MPRRLTRLFIPAFALIALIFLFPTLAAALPQRQAVLSAAERPGAAPSLFSKLWGALSVLWAETGSVLEPDGSPKPNTAGSGDTGSRIGTE